MPDNAGPGTMVHGRWTPTLNPPPMMLQQQQPVVSQPQAYRQPQPQPKKKHGPAHVSVVFPACASSSLTSRPAPEKATAKAVSACTNRDSLAEATALDSVVCEMVSCAREVDF